MTQTQKDCRLNCYAQKTYQSVRQTEALVRPLAVCRIKFTLFPIPEWSLSLIWSVCGDRHWFHSGEIPASRVVMCGLAIELNISDVFRNFKNISVNWIIELGTRRKEYKNYSFDRFHIVHMLFTIRFSNFRRRISNTETMSGGPFLSPYFELNYVHESFHFCSSVW